METYINFYNIENEIDIQKPTKVNENKSRQYYHLYSSLLNIEPKSILEGESIPLSTYEKFNNLIFDVEEAFITQSNRLKFMSLVSLCEGIINHILLEQHIPLHYVNDDSKRWLNFCEKLNTFLLINSPTPINNLNEFQRTGDTYQKMRNLVFHGNPDVHVTQEHVDVFMDMAKYLLRYDIDQIACSLIVQTC